MIHNETGSALALSGGFIEEYGIPDYFVAGAFAVAIVAGTVGVLLNQKRPLGEQPKNSIPDQNGTEGNYFPRTWR